MFGDSINLNSYQYTNRFQRQHLFLLAVIGNNDTLINQR